MNLAGHQTSQTIIHEAVSLQSAQPGETRTDEPQTEMAAPCARARVSCMAVAFILDLQLDRVERRQEMAHPLDGRLIHSSAP